MSDPNYDQDISIDPDALDIEWTKQAQTFFKYAELTARAHVVMDRKKEKIDVLEATMGLKIRTNPASYGLEKITEGAVQSTILIDQNHIDAVAELADLKYEYEVLIAAVRALDQKKSALENLVRLQGQNYFAGPSVPREIGKEWAKDVERTGARDKIKEKMGAAGRSIKR